MTPFRIRQRIKQFIRRARSEDTPPGPAEDPGPQEDDSGVVNHGPHEVSLEGVEDAGPPDDVEQEAEPTPKERQAAHWNKTRKGVLEFVAGAGGQSDLRAMHAFSESTYFVAHQRFSKLMEELTDEGLLDYDFDAGVATLTEAGYEAIG